jgi:hypothetical protein
MSSLAACVLAATLAAPVAHLRVATKDVKVFHGKTVQAASKDMPLELADEVEVPVGGFALVQIDRNGQLVRIDEDLRLAIRDLAALEAPKTTVTLEDQVNALLTSTEKAPASAERLVGWYVAPAAAQVRTSSGLPKDEEGAARKRLERSDAPPGGPPPTPAAPSTSAPVAPPPAKPAPSMPQAAALPQPDEATRACLREAVRQLGESAFRRIGPAVTVKLRRGDHRVVVFLEGAVPVSACVQTWAERQAAFLPERGWLELEVPLE